MTVQANGGPCSPLDPGEYQYRLLVDGTWQDHAEAADRVANPFGSENCVLKVF